MQKMLERSPGEEAYGAELEKGHHRPVLIFGDLSVADAIAAHPAALWRAKHPHGKLAGEEDED